VLLGRLRDSSLQSRILPPDNKNTPDNVFTRSHSSQTFSVFEAQQCINRRFNTIPFLQLSFGVFYYGICHEGEKSVFVPALVGEVIRPLFL
jgi:hypothetical protein